MTRAEDRLRVATFNIRYDNPADGVHAWPRRRRAVLETIRSLGCDIVALQEVLPRQRLFLGPRLPQLRWYGVGRADGRRRGEQSPLLVRPGRVSVTDWETVWLSATPSVPGSTGVGARVPRVATVLRAQWGRTPIGVIGTHFDHRSADARADAAGQLAALVAAEPDRAWVVCGDLNASADDRPLEILRESGLCDVLRQDLSTGTLHGFAGHRDGARIDHILVEPCWRVISARVDTTRPGGIVPSDHWPVMAEIALRAG